MNLTQPIGFIGAGKVGCSMGKYLSENGFPISGYYSRTKESAFEAARFTNSVCYSDLEELIKASDIIFIATKDNDISFVWNNITSLSNLEYSLNSKIICHFSGSLSSDVFCSSKYKVHPASIHPMLAVSDKFNSWKQLAGAFFTLEGDETALEYFSQMFKKTKNCISVISADKKSLYHTAASIISNDVIALLDIGLDLFMNCGFSKENAYQACAPLIRGNIENVLSSDTVFALTGPIERNDISTVEKHLDSLNEENAKIYCLLGKRLVKIAEKKHPETDFSTIKNLLEVQKI